MILLRLTFLKIEKKDELEKVCIISDSVGKNLDMKVVENALGRKVRISQAYSSLPVTAENEAVHATVFPDRTVQNVIK